MKLLFNPLTKSIIMADGHAYYDMRTGTKIDNPGKLPKLRPFSQVTKSKFEKLNPTTEMIEFDDIPVILIQNLNNLEEWQLSGPLPRYFWKGCLKLIKNGTLHL